MANTSKDAPSLQLDFVEIVAPRLWISATYKNTYVATSPTAVFSVDNPTGGWYDCGTIMAVRIPVTKEVFEAKAGIPKTTRKLWEVDRTAQITFNTQDLTPYVEALIKGQTLYNTLIAVGSKRSHVASLMTKDIDRKTLAKVASAAGFEEYDLVVCGSPTAASLEKNFNLAMVESFTASVITLADSGFPIDMALEDVIRKVDKVEFIDSLGDDTVRSCLLFWDTLVSSSTPMIQHALYFPKIRNFSGGDMDMKDSAEPYEEAITLSAQAVNMTYDDASTGYNLYKKWVLQY